MSLFIWDIIFPQNQYRSDLNWMKGVGWETEGCLNIAQAKKAGDLLSDASPLVTLQFKMLNIPTVVKVLLPQLYILFSQVKYRQKADKIKFTHVADDLSMKHAKMSQELQSDVRSPPQTLLSRVFHYGVPLP